MTVEARKGLATVSYLPSNAHEYSITFNFLDAVAHLSVFIRVGVGEDGYAAIKYLTFGEDFYVEFKDGVGDVWGIVKLLPAAKKLKFETITIYRDIPNSQDRIFSSQMVFSEVTERALDKLTMLAQDNDFREYVVHAPEDDIVAVAGSRRSTMLLPTAQDRAGKYLMFGDSGQVIAGYDEVTKALRQPHGELTDPSFIISKAERSGNLLTFDDLGRVKFVNLNDYYNAAETSNSNFNGGRLIEIVSNGSEKIVSSTVYAGDGVSIDEDTGEISSTYTGDSVNNTIVIDGNEVRGNYQAGKGVAIDGNVISSNTAGKSYLVFNATLEADGWVSGESSFGIVYEDESELRSKKVMATAVGLGNYIIVAGGSHGAGSDEHTNASSTVADVDVFVVNKFNKVDRMVHNKNMSPGVTNGIEHNFNLQQARADLAGTALGDFALFAGGEGSGSGGNYRSDIDVFSIQNGTIEQRPLSNHLSLGRSRLAATTVSRTVDGVLHSYAIFAGGYASGTGGNYRDVVDIYKLDNDGKGFSMMGRDQSLAANTSTMSNHNFSLKLGRSDLAATAIGNCAIFAGGREGQGDSVGVVDVFFIDPTGQLRKTSESPAYECHNAQELSAISIGDYAIFAGGEDVRGGNTRLDEVTVFGLNNEGLPVLIPHQTHGFKLKQARTKMSAASTGDYCMFFGGEIETGKSSEYIDCFRIKKDNNGTVVFSMGHYNGHVPLADEGANGLYHSAGATSGTHMLFAGGNKTAPTTAGGTVDNVYVYKDSRNFEQRVIPVEGGLESTDIGIVDVVTSNDPSVLQAQIAEWDKIITVDIEDNAILATCAESFPNRMLNIQIKV